MASTLVVIGFPTPDHKISSTKPRAVSKQAQKYPGISRPVVEIVSSVPNSSSRTKSRDILSCGLH